MARPSGQDFPKHKGGLTGNFVIPSLSGFPKFPKWPDLVDRIFQNIRADFSEILEIGKLGARILKILELSLGGLIVTHPMTDHSLHI